MLRVKGGRLISDEERDLAAAPPPRWVLGLGHVPLFALWSLFFLVLSYLPSAGTDVWRHVIYGEWILEHRSLPVEDPVMPLAEGMEVVHTAWLSQVILAAAERAGGAEWLSRLFALTVLVTYLVLARVFYLGTGSKLLSTLGVLAALGIGWGRSTSLGPESFGALCFASLLWLITGGAADDKEADGTAADKRPAAERRTLHLWLGVPLLLALWANLHESFVYGLAVLGCCFLGRTIDVAWQTRSLRRVLADRKARRWLYLTELGAAATLLNPYGIDLLLHTLWLPASDNLRSLPEWQPLVISGIPGLTFVVSGVVLAIVLRHSRRRMPAAHFLLLAVFGAGAASGLRMFTWYGPVFALVLVPHLAELMFRRRAGSREARPAALVLAGGRLRLTAGPSWHYSLLCATLAAMAFLLTPLGSTGRVQRSLGQIVGPATPLQLTGYLAANPPKGLFFNPAHWGDWLALQGPRGLKPFVTTNVRAIPPQVWRSYLRISGAGYEWPRLLDRYVLDTVILDKAQNRRLMRAMRNEEGWETAYEDDQAMVLVRHVHSQPPGQASAAREPSGGEPGVEGSRSNELESEQQP